MYLCTISIHIICEWHAEARGEVGEGVVYSGKTEKWVGVLTLFISKNKFSSFFNCTPSVGHQT